MSFSERYGYKSPRSIIQLDFMDQDLRNSLWNCLYLNFWEKANRWVEESPAKYLFQSIWFSHFKTPLDSIPRTVPQAVGHVRNYFFNCEWNEVYDFIEFIAIHALNEEGQNFIDCCNNVLKKNLSAYRFVGGKVLRITEDIEIEAIESALEASEPFPGVRTHLETALSHLADRVNPDARNSIKESISAVEALASSFTGMKKADLDTALNRLELRGIKFHPALKVAFQKLYGWTSDAEGIRHSLLNEPTLTFNDAKFMLVACSAFINYLLAKASATGLDLSASTQSSA